jgi:hypothetical protein
VLVQAEPASLQSNVGDGHERKHVVVHLFYCPYLLHGKDDVAADRNERRGVQYDVECRGSRVLDEEGDRKGNLK